MVKINQKIKDEKHLEIEGVCYNDFLCLPVTDFPGLKPNSTYITDDTAEFVNYYKQSKREIDVWDIERQDAEL
jgi:hypothetical protein